MRREAEAAQTPVRSRVTPPPPLCKSPRRPASLLHVAALAGLWACACGRGPPDPDGFLRSLERVFATLAERAGAVQTRHRDELSWRDAEQGATFLPGQWLKTGRASAARIELLGSGRLALESNALVLLEVPTPAEPGAPVADATLDVGSGTLGGVLARRGRAVAIRAEDGAEGRLTATSDAPVEYRVERSGRGTEVAIRSGEATLTVAGRSQPLASGQLARVARPAPTATVKVTQLLAPPALQLPAPDARVVLPPGGLQRFTWASATSAKGYRLQLSRDDDFLAPSTDVEVDAAEHTGSLSGSGVHHWRVAAIDAEGRRGDFGPARVLNVIEPIDDRLLEPEEGAALKLQPGVELRFSWRPSPGSRRYRLVVSRSLELERPVAEVDTEQTQHGLSTLAPGSYYWGVYDESDRPLFPRARALKLIEGKGELKIPRQLQQWGP